MTGLIYIITQKSTRLSYVGATEKTIKHRINGHFSAARKKGQIPPVNTAMRIELDRDCWDWAVLEVVKCETRAELLEREGYWIARLGTLVPNGFNVAEKGCKRSGERNSFYGKKHKPEVCAAISKWNSENKNGPANPFFSKHHKPETRALIASIRTGTKSSDATKAKLSAIGKGRILTEEHCANISKGKLGRPNGTKGIPKSAEHNRKMALTKVGKSLVNGKFVYFEDNVLRAVCRVCKQAIITGKNKPDGWLHIDPVAKHHTVKL